MATYHLTKVPWEGTLVRWTLKVPPCHPTLDLRPERGSPPPTPPGTFAGNVGGGGGTLGPKVGGGGDLATEVRHSGCALAGPLVAPGGSLPARGRPANGRRRSPARPSVGRQSPMKS